MFMIYNAIEKKKQNLWRHNLGNKQLHYTDCPISQEVKGNHTIKFGQLIECNMRKISLEKSDPFVKN